MEKSDSCLDILGALLRSELSAVETYMMAARSFPNLAAHPLIEGIRAAHTQSAEVLRGFIIDAGGSPSGEAPIWSGLIELRDNPPHDTLNKSPVLAVFQAGEKFGVRQYEATLDSGTIPENIKAIIRDDLLPRTWQHWLHMEGLAV